MGQTQCISIFKQKAVFILAFICFSCLVCQSQIFLQLERFNSPKTIKFIEGDELEFRLHEYPKTWRKGILDRIMLEEERIILDGGIYQLDEIKDLRITRHNLRILGTRFYQFSVVWSTFAAIADLSNAPVALGQDDSFKIGLDTVAISAGSAFLGFLSRSVFGRKKYKLGKNSRLRFLDLRLSVEVNR